MGTRQELSDQHRSRKHSGKTAEGSDVDADLLSSEFYPDVFQSVNVHSTVYGPPGSALHRPVGGGSTFNNDNHPGGVSTSFQEELYLSSSLPQDRRSASFSSRVTNGAGKFSHVTNSERRLHSPSAIRRILKPLDSQNRQGTSKEEFTAPEVYTDRSPSVSFRKHWCPQADVASASGRENSRTIVNNTAVRCIDRLENLKRNIEHCNTENLTHFNNTGFAQLQSGTEYDDYDNANQPTEPEPWAHRRNKSMSPKMAAALIHLEMAEKSKATRKLSEPSQVVHRTDSISSKITIPEMWSKSAENSPVIVRKALPNPGSPVIVQRTPSQSPSVERRFPANAPADSALSGHCADSLDSSHTRSQVHHKMLSKPQGCLEAREASHTIREKATAEISLPHVFHSPMSVRKMPESPILLSTAIHHQDRGKERELSNRTVGDCTLPAALPLEPSVVHYMKMLSSSSCSSSSSESPNQKPRLQEDSVTSFILPSTSSTSSFSAALCTSSPTPIQFCPQPKGIPIRTCTMVSQPSAAVIIASRESEGSFKSMDVSMEPKEDTKTVGEKTNVYMHACTDSQESHASSPKQQCSSAVTEDSIKENSQTAVFGSVSPKLLRHRRLIKDNSHSDGHSDSQHTFPKQTHSIKITTTMTSPPKAEKTVAGHVEDEKLAQLSQSAPSSFSSPGTNGNAGMGSKTLGQRIREVIYESNAGASSKTVMSSIVSGIQRRQFSKDDIFTSTILCEKSSYSFSNHSSKSDGSGCDERSPFRNAHKRNMGEETCEAKAATHRTKRLLSHASTKDTVPDMRLAKSTGYSDHLRSARDSCSSCVSDSSQTDSYGNPCVHRHLAELTQANVHHQTELLSAGSHPKGGVSLAPRLGAPGQRLVTSDTSDTLSTDRDTSSSSKRESSTSTATDDTLMSFRTRSTADSADYDEFVLPATLVFVRSVEKGPQHDACGFESEQMTVKRKLTQGPLPGLRTEQESSSYKTRKKRRKQLFVHSQMVTATHEHSDSGSTLKRNGAARNVYSDELSDDSDLFGSKDDISDLPSSRDDMSDLPSSRDDISDLPSSRDDISDLPGINRDRSDFTRGQPSTSGAFNSVNTSKSSATSTYVFHRSDLHSQETPVHSTLGENRSRKRNLVADDHTFTESTDTLVDHGFDQCRSSSQDSSERPLISSDIAGHLKEPGAVLQQPQNQSRTFEKVLDDSHSNVPSASYPLIRPCTRLPASSPLRTILTKNTKDRDSHKQREDTNVSSLYAADDDDEGKRVLLQSPESENTAVVFSCTIYNSACQRLGAQD